MHFINYVIQPNKKYNIILEELIGVLRDGVWPPPNHSRTPPGGFWFLVAAALSYCKNPSEKYVYSGADAVSDGGGGGFNMNN